MSRDAKWILGVFATLFVLVFAFTLRNSTNKWATGALIAFCLAIAIACFSSKGRKASIRFLGSFVFLTYVSYFLWEISTGLHKAYEGLNQAHWINALLGTFLFGLPGIYVAIKGIYPAWGLRAEVFRGEENKIATEGSERQEGHLP